MLDSSKRQRYIAQLRHQKREKAVSLPKIPIFLTFLMGGGGLERNVQLTFLGGRSRVKRTIDVSSGQNRYARFS